ncbi:MAG: NUDIX hydrolase [Candidatus Doudnabacteria bacterium]|nr:NUDIX hydrolase [Candidatus Doudnabacteria bacterium]
MAKDPHKPEYWKTTSEKVFHTTPWAEFVERKFVRQDGENGTYTFLRTPGAIGVVPIDKDNNVILHKQYRYLFESWDWEIFGGGMNKGEEHEAAARRELQEETGVTDPELEFVGEYEPANALVDETNYLYVWKNAEIDESFAGDPLEPVSDYLRVPLEEVPVWLASQQTRDGFSITGLLFAYGYLTKA